ncbi:MAG UNVERIFIED_CONTAM: hypothetical protein LOD86_11210, partial [Thermobifida fusca]
MASSPTRCIPLDLSPPQKTGGQRLTDIPVFPGVRPAPAFVAGARVGRTSTPRSRGFRVTLET